jgi:predicted small lipoprotein YifL
MKLLKTMALAGFVALVGLAGCGDDKSPANLPDGGAPGSDAAGPTFALFGWVDGLVKNHSTPTSTPDTVDDKNIIDTQDPTAFDSLLK